MVGLESPRAGRRQCRSETKPAKAGDQGLGDMGIVLHDQHIHLTSMPHDPASGGRALAARSQPVRVAGWLRRAARKGTGLFSDLHLTCSL
jgi:hypothetical protein